MVMIFTRLHSTFSCLIQELRPLRLSYQESLPEYQSKKGEYDAQVQMVDDSIAAVTNVTISLRIKKTTRVRNVTKRESVCARVESDRPTGI